MTPAASRSRQQHPEIDLWSADVAGNDGKSLTYREDLKHPSVAGSYLTACVFYASFFGHPPKNTLYNAGLPVKTAKALQDIAWATVTEWKK